MKCVGGAAMVVASGWMSSKVFEGGETHGGMAAVGFFGLFVLVSAFGIAFSKNA